MGRRDKQKPCSRSYIAVTSVEEGVIDFYRSLQLSVARAAVIRETIIRELAGQTEQAARDVAEARRQQERLDNERQKLLEAHYAGAIPLDILKREMDRLTRELHEADTRAATVAQSQEELVRLLDAALTLATNCYRLYDTANHRERRMFNQGFFTRLYIAADGSVDHAELQEPFVQLMARDKGVVIARKNPARAASPSTLEIGLAATGTDGVAVPQLLSRGQQTAKRQAQRRQEAVLISFGKDEQTQLSLGSNIDLLAVAEGFEPSDGGYPSHAFEACSLGRSDTPPAGSLPGSCREP